MRMTTRLFGPYELESLIGVGGMGEVWRARDTRRDRLVAIKLLPESLAYDREFTSRFRRESEVAARLREPHVIPIHDYGEIDGRLFIEMRLVDGRDLAGVLEGGPLAPARAVAIVSQIADALESAHADGLVHRDIKPSNVLVTANDFVYVVDFGIARSLGSTRTALTISGATVGTLDYMAPERFTNEPIDGRTDIYSLACLLCECLTGQRPFVGTDLPSLLYAHLNLEPPRPSELVEGVPPELDAVVARGMAKRPDERFDSPCDMAGAAKAALAAAPAEPVPAVPAAAGSLPATPTPGWPPAAWTAAPYPAADVAAAPGVGFLSADSSRSPVEPQAPPPPPPYLSPPPPGGGRDASAGRRRQRWLALAGVLVLLAVAGGLTALFLTRDKGSTASVGTPSTTGAAASSEGSASSSAPPAPSSAPPAASLAVPTVEGDPIPVDPMPNFMVVAPNGRYAYIAHVDPPEVTVLDTTTNGISSHIPMPGPPHFITFSPKGDVAYVTIYNADYTYNAVSFLNTVTNTVEHTVPVGHRPFAPTTSPDGKLLYVPLHNEGRVQVLDTTSAKEVASYAVAKNPHWMVVNRDGSRGYTANHESNLVSVLDLTNGGAVLTTIPVGTSPHSITLSPDGSQIAVVCYDSNDLWFIDPATNSVVKTVPVGLKPQDVVYAPDGKHAYTANVDAGTISVVDTATFAVTATIATGTSPTSITLLPDGRTAYVTNLDDATLRVLRTGAD
jgi:serine/threonine-protein kinase